MEDKHFFELEQPSFRFSYFCFIDVSEYLADSIFIKHKVRVWFQQEYRKEGTDYIAIFCKVRKKDRADFLNAMKELEQKMLLLGYHDYSAFCTELHDNAKR